MSETTAFTDWLQEVRGKNVHPALVCERFARHQPRFLVPGGKQEADSGKIRFALKITTPDGQNHAVLFTHKEAMSDLYPNGESVWVPAGSVLRSAISQGFTGVAINVGKMPGGCDYVLDGPNLINLLREYAVEELRHQTGAWGPTAGPTNTDGGRLLPLYVSRQDAESQFGSDVAFHKWEKVRQWVESDAQPVLQHGMREQMPLYPYHVASLCNSGWRDALEHLEQAIGRSGGIVDTFQIWEAMSRVELIWTLSDRDGDIVSLTMRGEPFMFLFSTAGEALEFLNKQGLLERSVPRLVRARPLFHHIGSKERPPLIGINVGSGPGWVGPPDIILPNVLNLNQPFSGRPAQASRAEAAATKAETPRHAWWRRLFAKRTQSD